MSETHIASPEFDKADIKAYPFPNAGICGVTYQEFRGQAYVWPLLALETNGKYKFTLDQVTCDACLFLYLKSQLEGNTDGKSKNGTREEE